MNAIFIAVCVCSSVLMLICAPTQFLPAVTQAGQNALQCAITLFCVYAFWMGLSRTAEDAKLTQKVATLLNKPCKRLFKSDNDGAIKSIAMNLSCNLLGIGGAATPYAVDAITRLEKDKNYFAQNLLFIINATSLQLIPTTVIALRSSFKSLSPHDIALPTLITSALCQVFAVGLYFIYCKVKKWRT